jgi:hypothetical protein
LIPIHITCYKNFVAERAYVVDLIFRDLLGLTALMHPTTDPSVDWILDLHTGPRIVLKDAFFKNLDEKKGLFKKSDLPDSKFDTEYFGTSKHELIGLWGDSTVREEENGMYFGNDILATGFFMLSRWEEYFRDGNLDEHDRFDENKLVAKKLGFIHRPIVNEYVEFFRDIFTRYGLVDMRKKYYRFKVTHDVDMFRRFPTKSAKFRALAGDLVKRKNFKQFYQNLMNKQDPFDTFDFLMDVSDEFNLTSEFYFIPGELDEPDVHYSIRDKEVGATIKKIMARTHLVCYHGSYLSYDDINQQYEEIIRLKDHINIVHVVRQHYLRLKMGVTWKIHEEMGFPCDSSLGLSSGWGFRSGLCCTYAVYDMRARRRLNLEERPITLMDSALIKTHPDPQDFIYTAKKISDVVRKYDGEFILLWHNSSFNLPEWEPFKSEYRDLIKALR